ncbi:MAG: hypothetical protein ACRD3T_07510 [Terriglobia bacterium]
MTIQNSTAVKPDSSDLARSSKVNAHLNVDYEAFRQSFDREPFGFTHNLSGLDLFTPDSLQNLAENFSESPRDYFIAGSAASPGTTFYSVPNGGLNPREAVESLDKGHHRVLLKRPENHDARFRDLLEMLFRQVVDLRGGLGGERVERLESAVLISSGSTTTPIHFDPEVGFFSQIEGEKSYHVYPPDCASEAELERFYIRGRVDIGNVDMSGLDSTREHVFYLGPGKGLHQPQNAPHWVQTGNSRSVSYTFVFQTAASRALGRTRAFNYCLRKCRFNPSLPRTHPGLDAAKAGAMHAAMPIQFAGRILNKAQRVLTGRRLSGG